VRGSLCKQLVDALLIEPGSRHDVIFDFKESEGRRLVLWNVGLHEPHIRDFDYMSFPMAGPGSMPTGRVMAFDVTLPLGESAPDDFNAAFAIGPTCHPSIPEPTGVHKVALLEGMDKFGLSMPLLETMEPATDHQGQPICWPNTKAHQLAGLAGKQMEGTMA